MHLANLRGTPGSSQGCAWPIAGVCLAHRTCPLAHCKGSLVPPQRFALLIAGVRLAHRRGALGPLQGCIWHIARARLAHRKGVFVPSQECALPIAVVHAWLIARLAWLIAKVHFANRRGALGQSEGTGGSSQGCALPIAGVCLAHREDAFGPSQWRMFGSLQ